MLLLAIFFVGALAATSPPAIVAHGAPCNGAKDHSPCPAATPGPLGGVTIDGKPAPTASAPFAAGETLVYEVDWMGIDVGSVTSKAEPIVLASTGHAAIHLSAAGSSNRSFSLFYSARGAEESWIDSSGLFSLGFVHDEHYGGQVDHQEWSMDYAAALAHRHRTRQKKSAAAVTTDLDVPLTMTNVQDEYSATYFYRAFPLKAGQKLEMDVFQDKDMWKISVEALAKETIKVPAGTFDCLKVRPTATRNGVALKKGEMTVWVTDDAKRIPVKTQASTPFGKVNAVLTSWSQQGAPAPSPSPAATKKSP